jgi:hypothetical protein
LNWIRGIPYPNKPKFIRSLERDLESYGRAFASDFYESSDLHCHALSDLSSTHPQEIYFDEGMFAITVDSLAVRTSVPDEPESLWVPLEGGNHCRARRISLSSSSFNHRNTGLTGYSDTGTDWQAWATKAYVPNNRYQELWGFGKLWYQEFGPSTSRVSRYPCRLETPHHCQTCQKNAIRKLSTTSNDDINEGMQAKTKKTKTLWLSRWKRNAKDKLFDQRVLGLED